MGNRSGSPFWSPDGTRLLFRRGGGEENLILDPKRRWEDQKLEALPRPPGPPGTPFPATAWVDGRVLGTLEGRLAAYDLSRRKYEVFEAVATGSATQAPKGRILFMNRGRLELFDPGTGRVSEILAAGPGQTIASPRVSADGRTLYFSRLTSESDVWMVEIVRSEPRAQDPGNRAVFTSYSSVRNA